MARSTPEAISLSQEAWRPTIARRDIATSSRRQLGSGMGGSYYPYVLTLAFGHTHRFTPAVGLVVPAGFSQTTSPAGISDLVVSFLGQWFEPESFVAALAFGADGSLYAGWEISSAGGVLAKNVARWDVMTSSWLALSSGTNDDVYALAVGSDGSLYAGGWFTIAGGTAANQIARWDWELTCGFPWIAGWVGMIVLLAFMPWCPDQTARLHWGQI